MQTISVPTAFSKLSAISTLAHLLRMILNLIETEWRDNSWARYQDSEECALLRNAHRAIAELTELLERKGS